MKTKPAIRGTFRTDPGQIRLTEDGCVMDADIRLLDPVETRTVSVCGALKVKQFQPLRWRGKTYLAECITGTLYDAQTGQSPSPQLYIVSEQ